MKFHYKNGALFAELKEDSVVFHHPVFKEVNFDRFIEHTELMAEISYEIAHRIVQRNSPKNNLSAPVENCAESEHIYVPRDLPYCNVCKKPRD